MIRTFSGSCRRNGFILLLAMPLAAFGAGAPPDVIEGSDPATEWQEAAFNYEYAAEAQEHVAVAALDEARYLRDTPEDDSTKARRGKVKAGQLEMRAAELLQAAAVNLDHASRTWKQASSAAGANSASAPYFSSASKASSKRATSLLRQAVDLCEQAAVGFSVVDELLHQATANQKAAVIRERLASRRWPVSPLSPAAKADP